MAEPQKYVATDGDQNEAWERANMFADEVFMSNDELCTLLEPMGFSSDIRYEFEQQNSDNNNGITLAGWWNKHTMDLDAFLKLVEERESRTLYVGDELVGFKPTIYHRGYVGNNDLRVWFDALQALEIDEFEFETDHEPGGDGKFAQMFYMITDTIRRHNDARLHESYEHHLAQIVEQKQEELDCADLLINFTGEMLDEAGDKFAKQDENSSRWDTIKPMIDNRDVLHRMLVNKGAEELADLLTGSLFNHDAAFVKGETPEAEVEGTPV